MGQNSTDDVGQFITVGNNYANMFQRVIPYPTIYGSGGVGMLGVGVGLIAIFELVHLYYHRKLESEQKQNLENDSNSFIVNLTYRDSHKQKC